MLSGVACGSDDESGCCRCHGSVVQFSSVQFSVFVGCNEDGCMSVF